MTGQLRQLVQLQKRVQLTDALGQPINEWTTFAVPWADVRHQSGKEALRAGAELSTVRASVRIRWRTDVTEAHRLLINRRPYDIKAVMPDLANRQYLDLVCEVSA